MRPAAYEVNQIEVLELARVILFHYTQHGTVEPPPISGQMLSCARRLLSLYSKEKGGKLCWGHTVMWRRNLQAAGLDPDTLAIRDPLLWQRASEHLLKYGTLNGLGDEMDDDGDVLEPSRSFKGKIARRARERREHQERQKAQQELEERQTQQITGPPSAKDAIRQMFGLPFR
jgi:hypothetical protein